MQYCNIDKINTNNHNKIIRTNHISYICKDTIIEYYKMYFMLFVFCFVCFFSIGYDIFLDAYLQGGLDDPTFE